MTEDLYKILGVDKSASKTEIKKAYATPISNGDF